MAIKQSIVESIQDDWLSDHEIQSDYQDEFSLTAPDAYLRMVSDLSEWIKEGVLIPGDMLDGFQAWPGTPDALSERFAASASRFAVIEQPGQIGWFDLGPTASEITA